MSQSNTISRHWVELDVLRSIAVTLMVVNHAAVRANSPSTSGVIDAAAFVGSFAPVIFFFLTGLGSGVQSIKHTAGRFRNHLIKAVILLVADSFIWVRPSHLIGMDFLGFISLSSLIIYCIGRIPGSGYISAGLAVAFVFARYAIRLIVLPWFIGHGWAVEVVGFVLGIGTLPGFSYPFGPWLAYPFAGYALGRLAAHNGHWILSHRERIILVFITFASLLTIATIILTTHGFAFFRWGDMSLAYFVASLSVIVFGLALVLEITILLPESCRSWLGITGIQSLICVPLHYQFLSVSEIILGPITDDLSFLFSTIIVLIMCVVSSYRLQSIFRILSLKLENRLWILWVFLGTEVIITWLVLAFGLTVVPINSAVRCLSQLGLCQLFTLPIGRLRTSIDQYKIESPNHG